MLDDLILLRLLAVADPASGGTRSDIRSDLRSLATDPGLSEAQWREIFTIAVDRLREAGHLVAGGRPQGARLRLTDSGQDRARDVFNVPAHGPHPPADDSKKHSRKQPAGWAWWRDHYVLPKALGSKHAARAEELRAALLHRLFLPELSDAAAPATLAAAVDLLLAKRLAVSPVSLAAFRAAAVRAWAAGGESPTDSLPPDSTADKPEPATETLPVEPPQEQVRPEARLPQDLNGFAERVLDAARHSGSERVGGNKVFISHVWRTLVGAGHAAEDEERLFKQLLTRANTAGVLRLSRADLAGSQEAADVQASETRYLGESFHFVRLD